MAAVVVVFLVEENTRSGVGALIFWSMTRANGLRLSQSTTGYHLKVITSWSSIFGDIHDFQAWSS